MNADRLAALTAVVAATLAAAAVFAALLVTGLITPAEFDLSEQDRARYSDTRYYTVQDAPACPLYWHQTGTGNDDGYYTCQDAR